MSWLRLILKQLGPLGHVLTLLGFLGVFYQFSEPLHALVTSWSNATHDFWQALLDLFPTQVSISDNTNRSLTLCALSLYVLLNTKSVRLSGLTAAGSAIISFLSLVVIFVIIFLGSPSSSSSAALWGDDQILKRFQADYYWHIGTAVVAVLLGAVSYWRKLSLRKMLILVFWMSAASVLGQRIFGSGIEVIYQRIEPGSYISLLDYRIYRIAISMTLISLITAFALGRSRTFISILLVVIAIVGADYLVTKYPLS
ncbi:hypothetical protein [Hyphococcus sp.]|uniref:hypothetical protein n=1 Tax=Hyphococcus sp. TaxID=2038636 RepID=UPI0035C746B6